MHGDFNSCNILLHAGGVAGVLPEISPARPQLLGAGGTTRDMRRSTSLRRWLAAGTRKASPARWVGRGQKMLGSLGNAETVLPFASTNTSMWVASCLGLFSMAEPLRYPTVVFMNTR